MAPKAAPKQPVEQVPQTAAESGLVAAAKTGVQFDGRTLPEGERAVRASFLKELLLGQVADATIASTGLRALGLIFPHSVDLEHLSRDGQPLPLLKLGVCLFKENVSLRAASFSELSFVDSRFEKGLNLNHARILNNLDLERIQCVGGLRLHYAHIGGFIGLSGACLIGTGYGKQLDGQAMSADGATIAGGVFCNPSINGPFVAEGEVRFPNTSIGGIISFRGAQLRGSIDPSGNIYSCALMIERSNIGGGVFCDTHLPFRFVARGGIRLLASTMGNQLALNGALLLEAVDGQGVVRSQALSLDGARITGGLFATTVGPHRFEARGTVRMIGATIVGQLMLRGAHLTKSAGQTADPLPCTLVGDGMNVVGGAILDGGFSADACVRLTGANLDGILAWGVFSSDEICIDFNDATVKHLSVRLLNESRGRIRLDGTDVGVFDGFDPAFWGPRNTNNEPGVTIALNGMSFRRAEFAQSQPERLRTWARFREKNPIVEGILEVIDRSLPASGPSASDFFPQPFDEAAKVLRATGHSAEADEIEIAKRLLRLHCRCDDAVGRLLSNLSRLLFRYGYGRFRAIVWTVAFISLGAVFFWLSQWYGNMSAVNSSIPYSPCREAPLALALDTFLPIVDFRVEGNCEFRQSGRWRYVLDFLRIVYMALGWLFVPMVAITFSGILRKDR